MSLEEWKGKVDLKKGKLTEPAETMNILAEGESKNLEDESLTLEADTAPDISEMTVGKSESGLKAPPTAQTLLAALSNIMLIAGEEIFANAVVFREKMSLFKGVPDDETEQMNSIYKFIESLETFIRRSQNTVDILDTANYPLYVWFAAANINRNELVKSSAPLLLPEETKEEKITPPGPAPTGE